LKHEIIIASTAGGVTTTSATCDANRVPINGVNADLNATECDMAEVYTQPVLGAAETVTPFMVSASGGLVPAQLANGGVAILDSTHQSILLPGGMFYRFVKTATAAPTSLETYLKPRQH
jgi:hypothetical protein